MKGSLKQQAYEIIKERILRCEYLPNSVISESILQEEINASRTPIREALSRLEQENLVKIIPKKGILVADLSINEINMIYETRCLIEPFIIQKYGEKIDKQTLEEMREKVLGHEDEAPQATFERDDELHALLISPCKNTYLLSTLAQINAQNRRVRILSGNEARRRLETGQEHLEIINQLLMNNPEKAAKAMSAHLETSQSTAFSLLIKNGGWVSLENEN